MRCLPAILAALALSPRAGAADPYSVCASPTVLQTCDYSSIGAAMLEGVPADATLEVYHDGGTYEESVTIDRGITIRGMLNNKLAEGPMTASRTTSPAFDITCTDCTVNIENMRIDTDYGPGILAGARDGLVVNLSHVTVLATRNEHAAVTVSAPASVNATSGGVYAPNGGLGVDGGTLHWTAGTFATTVGSIGYVDAGTLHLSASALYAPGSVPALIARGTGMIEIDQQSTISGRNAQATVERQDGALILLVSGADLSLSDSSVRDGFNTIEGGLIRAGANSDIALTNATLENGTSSLDGGLIWAEGSASFTSTNSTFRGGLASYNGGGVKLVNVTTATISGGLFDTNDAQNGHGGGLGIYNTSATLTDVQFLQNTAGTDGGGLYVAATAGATVGSATFVANTAVADGGAIYALDTALDITGGSFDGNTAAFGGGVRMAVQDGSTRVLSVTGANFSSNTATLGGGAISGDGSTTVQIADTWFEGNNADRGSGGALSLATTGSGFVRRSLFCDNAADNGAGIYAFNDSAVLSDAWSNLVFFRNSAVFGGAVQLDGGRVDLGFTSFSHNLATAEGGGLYGTSAAVAVIHDSILSKSTGDGIVDNPDTASSLSFEGSTWGNQSVDLAAGVTGTPTALNAAPFPTITELTLCEDLDWSPSTGVLGGATDGIDPYISPLADFDQDGWTLEGGDCDDTNGAINPDAAEVCDDFNVDEDCDGLADDEDPSAESRNLFWLDNDHDGYGAGDDLSSLRCDPLDGEADNADDCNDENASIHPGATEICDDGHLVDEDCDGTIDDLDDTVTGQVDSYPDLDGDSFGDAGAEAVISCPGESRVGNNDDCDDGNADIHPEASERWYNEIDENCDGNLYDQDGDGSLADAATGSAPDCNDLDPAIHPNATDVPGDGINQNCLGDEAESYVGGTCGCSNAGTGGVAVAWMLPMLALLRRRS